MAHGNEINNKRYFWLKLERNFFKDARIKKLRRLAGGDTFTVIYLELLLLSLELDGKLVYEGIENTFAEEMASKINEWDNLENVKVCINWLISEGILCELNDGDYQFPYINVGSETKGNIYKKEQVVRKNLTNFQPTSNQILTDIRDKSIDIRDKNIYNNNTCEQNNAENNSNISNIETLFEQFWKEYPRKIGKPKCKEWFKKKKVDNNLLQKMLTTIRAFKNSNQWQEENGKYIPHPYTWLNRGGWEDEISVSNYDSKYTAGVGEKL